MHPRQDINALNRRRQYGERLRFARRRMFETVVELQFARGKIESLPSEFRLPPPWALEAARVVSEGWMPPVTKLTREEIEKDPRAVVQELLGVFDAMIASLAELPEKLPPELRRTEEGRAVRQIAEKLAKGPFPRYLLQLEKAMNCKLPRPTHQELIHQTRRYERGLTELFSPDEESGVVGMRTLSSQLYYLVWFFWPKLIAKPRLRAADLAQLVREETGLQFSTKLTEKIYTELRIAPFVKST